MRVLPLFLLLSIACNKIDATYEFSVQPSSSESSSELSSEDSKQETEPVQSKNKKEIEERKLNRRKKMLMMLSCLTCTKLACVGLIAALVYFYG